MSDEVKVDKVIAMENGPYIAMLDNNKKVALCRCGKSMNKPLCDGSHVACDFKAPAWELDVNS